MTFNIEWGGTNISFDSVLEAIRLSKADIVGIQEAEGNLQRLAGELGWNYNLRNYAISIFPLIEPQDSEGLYVLVETSPGKVVALANIHLPSDPAGPHEIRNGAALDEVMELERNTRLPFIQAYLPKLADLVAQGIPVFLTGDFNAPSHLDWTEAVVGSRPFLRYAVDWPVSRAVSNAGFKDSWRVIHPDPLTHPGLTWWAARPPLPSYAPGENDPQDRIDFVWYAGAAEAQESFIVAENGHAAAAIQVAPWPSDHRAVVSTFTVIPADMPELLATGHRIYEVGDEVQVIYHGAQQRATALLTTLAADGSTTPIGEFAVESGGRNSLPINGLPPGHYLLEVTPPNGGTRRNAFWVLDKSRPPVIEVIGSEFILGQPVPMSWSNGPGNRNDYVAVYPPGAAAQYEEGDYQTGLAWAYVGALPEGRMNLDAGNAGWGWPIPPGTYVMRLMKDDGYEVLAESGRFVVHDADISTGE